MSDFPPVKTIAIDFDGVIHRYSNGWCGGRIYDEPMEGAIESMERLIKKGFKVVILTARDDLEPVREWLTKHNFPDVTVTNTKPPAIAYIDDRAIRFTNWTDMVTYFI